MDFTEGMSLIDRNVRKVLIGLVTRGGLIPCAMVFRCGSRANIRKDVDKLSAVKFSLIPSTFLKTFEMLLYDLNSVPCFLPD